jgi:hypothetical protein
MTAAREAEADREGAELQRKLDETDQLTCALPINPVKADGIRLVIEGCSDRPYLERSSCSLPGGDPLQI